MSEWQPIETAPTDGRWIVVGSTWDRFYRAAVRWNEREWEDAHESSHSMSVNGWGENGPRRTATHWMDLPALPDGADEEMAWAAKREKWGQYGLALAIKTPGRK